jgi:hypothetical protein
MTQQQAENIVYFLEKTSPKTPADRLPNIPPTWRTDVNQPVALEDRMTVGKFVLKRYMTRDWPSTPCWYPYSKPPNLFTIPVSTATAKQEQSTHDANRAITMILGFLRTFLHRFLYAAIVRNSAAVYRRSSNEAMIVKT